MQDKAINTMRMDEQYLTAAQQGDMEAFYELFARFKEALASYLYRLTGHREEAEDLLHDTYLRAFEKLDTFRSEANLKTWVFTIATNLARNRYRVQKRWTADTKDRVKALAHEQPAYFERLQQINRTDPEGAFFIREHIDLCFTCMGKVLPLDQQVALLLKEVYQFKVREIAEIMGRTHGSVKHLLHNARTDMVDIFEARCAFVSKQGVCHQCSQLNGIFNPKQAARQEVVALQAAAESGEASRRKLLKLRARLVAEVDPLKGPGQAFQGAIMELCETLNP